MLYPKTEKAHHSRTHLSQMSHHLSLFNRRAALRSPSYPASTLTHMHIYVYLPPIIFITAALVSTSIKVPIEPLVVLRKVANSILSQRYSNVK